MLNHTYTLRSTIIGLLVAVIIGFAFSSTRAQDSMDQRLNFGDVKRGEINLSQIQSIYTFSVNEPETVFLRAESLTDGFDVAYEVRDASGAVITNGMHNHDYPTVLDWIDLPEANDFTVYVHSGNGVAGEYALTVDMESAATMRTFAYDEIMRASIRNDETPQVYTFDVEAEGTTFLMIDSPMGLAGPSFVIDDVTQEQTVAFLRLDVTGACLRLANNENTYNITVSPTESNELQNYNMMLWQAESPDLACPYDMLNRWQAPLVDENTDDIVLECMAARTGDMGLNVRAYPNTESTVIANIMPGTSVLVMARSDDNRWTMVDVDDVIGWAASSFLNFSGNCRDVDVMDIETGTTVVTDNDGGNNGDGGGTGGDGGDNGGGTGDDTEYLVCLENDPELCGGLINDVNDLVEDTLGINLDLLNGNGDGVTDPLICVENDLELCGEVVDVVEDTLGSLLSPWGQ